MNTLMLVCVLYLPFYNLGVLFVMGFLLAVDVRKDTFWTILEFLTASLLWPITVGFLIGRTIKDAK